MLVLYIKYNSKDFFFYTFFPSITQDVGVGVLEYMCDWTCFKGWGKKAEAMGGGNNVIY